MFLLQVMEHFGRIWVFGENGLVYSTCSINPIEDEAVVAAILSKYQGKLKLVDCSGELPGLVRLNGVNTWKVIGRDAQTIYSSEQDVSEAEKCRYGPTVFPRPEYAELHLDRCIRILPHLQDTGGFFICVIEKILRETKSRYKLKQQSLQPIKLYERQIWHLLIARMKGSTLCY